MFTELLPVLQDTIVTLTISRIDDQLLRVNIIPKCKTDQESNAENGLSTPVTVTATPAELDQDFARQLLSVSRSYQRSAANIREIEEAHAAAVKAAEEERKNGKAKKSAVPPAKTSPRSDNDSKAAPGAKPVFGSKGQSASAPTTQSLFDTHAREAETVPEKHEDTGVAVVVEQGKPEPSPTDRESAARRVLSQAGLLSKWNCKPSMKGTGFAQPLAAHQHWHIDVSYLNIGGTFYYLCSILDGYSRYIVNWDIRESMTEADIEIILQGAKEKHPEARPRIISDNGPQFIAKDFKEFIRISGMTHVRTSPFYPQSKGRSSAGTNRSKGSASAQERRYRSMMHGVW
jgi:PRTRC genetic system protein E